MTSATSCCANASASIAEDLPSAVNFLTDRRPHVSINVRSVTAALPFYRTLFNARPTKLRADYAKWESEDPPVNLTLNEHPDSVSRVGHFGIEVKSTDAVQEYLKRFRQMKVSVDATENDVACCFAVQTKIWAKDPDGNHWEIFVVTDADVDEGCGATCICYNQETGGCDWS